MPGATRERQHREGQVGAVPVLVRAQEDAEWRRPHGHGAAAQQRVLQRNAEATERRVVALIEGAGSFEPVGEQHLQMILQVGTDARPVGHDRNAMLGKVRRRSFPDSISNCGVLMAPAATITSRLATARLVADLCRYSTPRARRPSNRMRVVSALVSIRRFVRLRTGLRNARAALERTPWRWMTW